MIGVDWGTSSFRAYRIAAGCVIRETRSAACGVMAVAEGGFAATLEEQLGDWIEDGPIVMSGMVGSRQGWREVPYADCPADAAALARGLAAVAWGGRRAWIVPGLVCRTAASVPEVMRGEETQIIGALATLPERATLCLPGTHSKWVSVESGSIRSFATAMTGEVFAALRHHSILGRLMPADDFDDEVAFAEGLSRAGDAGGLLHHVFAARTLGLMAELPAAGLASYLSGILIGHEIAGLAGSAETVHLVGAPHLVALYERALRAGGRRAVIHDAECGARGLFLLARHLAEGG